jgi:hypothetical protein
MLPSFEIPVFQLERTEVSWPFGPTLTIIHDSDLVDRDMIVWPTYGTLESIENKHKIHRRTYPILVKVAVKPDSFCSSLCQNYFVPNQFGLQWTQWLGSHSRQHWFDKWMVVPTGTTSTDFLAPFNSSWLPHAARRSSIPIRFLAGA